MSKRILRCPTKTSNAASLGDLGLWSLQGRRNLKKLIYWRNIFFLSDSNLVKQSYLFSKTSGKKSSWAMKIRKLLIQYKIYHVWQDPSILLNLDNHGNNESKNNKDHKRFWNKFITDKILDYEQKAWNKLSLEKYLNTTNNPFGRALHSSIRNGSNLLEIEKGRWKHVSVEKRICTQCDSKKVEDEVHFLLICSRYKDLRLKLFAIILNISKGKWNLANIPINQQFMLLVNGTGDQYEPHILNAFQAYLVKFKNQRSTV